MRKVFMHHERVWLGALASIVLAMAVLFYTPASTVAARYTWNQWHTGELALILDKRDAALAFTIGEYYFGNQSAIGTPAARPYDLSLAEKAYGKAIEINSSIAFARYMRARIEFVRADFDAAVADLNAELSLYPANKRTLYMRGLTYAYRGLPGDLSLAEDDFKTFILWTPREWAGYNDLAFVLAKENKYADAAKVLKEGIAKADDGAANPWLWDALGVMELNLNENKAALASLIKAQALAAPLTDIDWQRAYPGNNPSKAHSGIEAIKNGIARNVLKAYAAQSR